MGIKSLNNFLRKKCPHVFIDTSLKDLQYKKIAIDISLYMCKYKVVCGDKWIYAFLNLIRCLRRNNIHCVFIYDNGAPPEKKIEKENRQKHKEKLEDKVFKLEELMNTYHTTGEIHVDLLELSKKIGGTGKRLLSNKTIPFNPTLIEEHIRKTQNYIIKITPKDIADSKELFDILQVPYFNAALEAETTCSELCINGLVDAVLSEDTDVLAYGTPIFLSKIDTKNDTCKLISHPHMLESLDLDKSQFTEFCIMCGTDYNKNIPKVGSQTAYKLIKENKNIENIGKMTKKNGDKYDISILNRDSSYRLFTKYKKSGIDKVPFCGKPNFEKLEEFLVKRNIFHNLDSMKDDFISNDIKFS
jgi:5'-3' exonuclease